MNVEIEVLDDDIVKIERWFKKILDGELIFPFYRLKINNFIDDDNFDDRIDICTSLKIFKMKSIYDKSYLCDDLYFKLNDPLDVILAFSIDRDTYIINDIRFFIGYKNKKPIIFCHKEDIDIFINKIYNYNDKRSIFEEYKYYKGVNDYILHTFEINRREEN